MTLASESRSIHEAPGCEVVLGLFCCVVATLTLSAKRRDKPAIPPKSFWAQGTVPLWQIRSCPLHSDFAALPPD